MIPDRIAFTDLDLDPRDVLKPRKANTGVFPSEWVRHQFVLPQEISVNLRLIDRWIERHLNGRYGSYLIYGILDVTVVVLFEQTTDAVMFRLQGGERAWIAEFGG